VVSRVAAQELTARSAGLEDERRAEVIVNVIVALRKEKHFESATEFADCVERAMGGRRGQKTQPATLTFQAIRMYVNDELGELARGLAAAERLLREGGRLVVVTFHSLEDRLVKQFMRTRSGATSGGSRYMPEVDKGPDPSFFLEKRKAIEPRLKEVVHSPRARSARLRVVTRTAAAAWSDPVETGLRLPPLESVEVMA